MARPALRAVALAGVAALALFGVTAPARADNNLPVVAHDEQITFQEFSKYPDWQTGTHQGTYAIPGHRTGITIDQPAGTTDFTDEHTGTTRSWEYATWTSPEQRIGFDATELVASWNAQTPPGTWIQVELHGTYNTGTQTPWYVMGRWASGDQDIKRATLDGQGDPWSTIWTDTFSIDDADAGVLLRSYQLRLTLYRAPGQAASPRVWMLGAMSSNVPDRFTVTPSKGGIAWGTELPVPRYSQNIHRGEYPEYDNGGEAWCSPTSTEMVVEYWGRKPTAEDTAWVDPSYADPTVDHAARMTYDYEYEGAGNWPFNTAYAASFPGLDARVTRLHSLDEVERFIKAGIPVVTSQSFLAEELDGANYGTSGHLFVVVGFTADGDVIVNDPASSSDEAVRNVYKRSQFEQIWLRTKRHRANGSVAGGSGGIAYLIKPADRPWPVVPGSTNW
ncbi:MULTISPECIES: C39 family peptidase [Micromonospora]|uniref:Peptidase C39 family protein n=1 Tax=Micromonospora solifontis TaxID=2487138 RepID=A0ABX9WMT7_9ACTN|nr:MULTISPECIES: C39 family peptidase [Micromonospora]NES13346.1 peptidase C39 family protein [Micromonospora sp. PPF5-17B]NES34715.1 peptidase C39 family protein [Micromonospora solifontis]NES57231.1 peptidase C39 family protein [Micromonospora sp. PPF5-6]RNM01952.1 peptidase C39 family protein [Micromonospora solifontis]